MTNSLAREAPPPVDSLQAAELIGRLLGMLPYALVPMICVFYGMRRMGHEDFNSKCMGAFTLAMLSVLAVLFTLPFGGSVATFGCLGAIGGSLVAPIFAIFGLIQRESGTRGIGYAIFAMLISAFVFLMATALAAKTFPSTFDRKPNERQPNGQPERHEFETYNFALELPSDYVTIEPKKINPDATFVAVRRKPDLTFMIIAEENPYDQVTTEAIAAIANGALRASKMKILAQEETPSTVAGIPGLERKTTLRRNGKKLRFIQWFATDRGSAYQLMTWASAGVSEPRQRSEHQRLLQAFEILDPTREAATTELVGRFESKSFPYSANLEDAPWRHWTTENHRADAPMAELAVRLREKNLVIYPVALQGADPSLPDLSAALLEAFVAHEPEKEPFRLDARVEVGGHPARHTRFDQEFESARYSLNTLSIRAGDSAYLISEWIPVMDDGTAAWSDLSTILEPTEGTKEPLSAELRTAQVRFWGSLGDRYRDRKDYTQAAEAFSRRYAYEGTQNYAIQWISNLQWSGQTKQALAAIDSLPEDLQRDKTVRSWRAYVLKSLGRNEEALATYEGLFEETYRDIDDLAFLSDLLLDAKRGEEALAITDRLISEGPALSLSLRRALLLQKLDRLDEGITGLRSALEELPFELDIALRLLDLYRDAERNDEAVKYANTLLEARPDDASLLYKRALSEYALRWYREAQASFRLVLARDPVHAKSQEYLDHLESLLGQGSTDSIRQPIEAVPIPDPVAASLGSIVFTADTEGVTYLHRLTSIKLAEEKYFNTFRMRAHVADRAGVSRMSTILFGFDPSSERLFVNELRVTDAEGTVVSTGKIDSYFVLDDSDEATLRKNLHLPIAGLAPGHTIDVVVTRERLGRTNEVPYRLEVFAYPARALYRALSYEGDVTNLRHEGIEPKTWERGVVWEQRDLLRTYSESYQPYSVEYLPFVAISDSARDWPSIGRDYLASIQDKLAIDSVVKSTAKALVSDIEDAEARVRTLAQFVQRNCVYKAIEFGSRGVIPNPAATTLTNRYGDCKDQAVLLRGLLAAIDVPSNLVLASYGVPIQKSVPSRDQFNHMILYVPSYRGGWFFDTTDAGLELGKNPPLGLGGREVLVLGSESSELREVPSYAPTATTIEVDRRVEFDDAGQMIVETVTFSGFEAGSWRSWLAGKEPAKRDEALRSALSSILDMESLRILETKHLDENVDPFVLRLTYRVASQRPKEDQPPTSVRALWERYYHAFDRGPRRSPFVFKYPIQIRSTVHLPEGYRFESDDSPEPATLSGIAVSRETTTANPRLVRTTRWQTGRFRLDADRYRDLLGFLDVALTRLESGFVKESETTSGK